MHFHVEVVELVRDAGGVFSEVNPRVRRQRIFEDGNLILNLLRPVGVSQKLSDLELELILIVIHGLVYNFKLKLNSRLAKESLQKKGLQWKGLTTMKDAPKRLGRWIKDFSATISIAKRVNDSANISSLKDDGDSANVVNASLMRNETNIIILVTCSRASAFSLRSPLSNCPSAPSTG